MIKHPNIGLLYRMFMHCSSCNQRTWHDLYGNDTNDFEYKCENHKHCSCPKGEVNRDCPIDGISAQLDRSQME